MKLHFHGTAEELTAIVESAGFKGQWQATGGGSRFTGNDGEIFVWYGQRLGTVMFQGKEPGLSRMRDRLKGQFGGEDSGVMTW